jgi:protein TonB
MGPRLSLVVSLLAACGIHAVVLLAPRAAIVEVIAIPTVELDLAAPVEIAAAAPVVARRVAPADGAGTAPQQPVGPIERPPSGPPAPIEAEGTMPAAVQPIEHPADSSGSRAGDAVAQPAAAPAAPVLVPPRPQSEILPAYPRSARRSGLEGVVRVSAMVDASGAVTGAVVLESSGHPSLDQAALEAVRRARFMPALLEGKAVPCRVVIPIRFLLRPGAESERGAAAMQSGIGF